MFNIIHIYEFYDRPILFVHKADNGIYLIRLRDETRDSDGDITSEVFEAVDFPFTTFALRDIEPLSIKQIEDLFQNRKILIQF